MAKKTRCALYARVSTLDQSTALQVEDLRAYVEKRGWSLVGEYVDTGISGTKDSRPQLNEMMSAVRKGKVDVVAVWRFDRFARSTKHLVTALDEFRDLNVAFVSLQENLDFSSHLGRAMFTIIAAIAELERNIILDRCRAGQEKARAAGKRIGRPRVEFDVGRARALRESGLSLRAISKQMGVAKSVLCRTLAPGRPIAGSTSAESAGSSVSHR